MTHKERVLDLLSDGKPHGHMEGYRLGVMLHSRVADLRRDGHTIDCWRDGDNYLYRLAPALDAASVPSSFGGAASSEAVRPSSIPAQHDVPGAERLHPRRGGVVAGGQLELTVTA